MIECISLTKKFGNFLALSDLNLTINHGVFGLLGTNGAGKTTTIKILVTLLKPTSGTAKIGGYDIRENPIEVKKRIGYLPEVPMLFDHLTGREFLELMGALRGVSEEKLEKRIEFLGKLLGITDYMDVLCSVHSKGTRQKFAFASAVLHEPDYLFLDEPLLGMDPKSWAITKDYIKKYGENHTVFLSTHITLLAEAICDTVGIIHRGKLVASGKLKEVMGDAHSLEEAFVSEIDGVGE